ncbi:MAG: uroporphyrinogen decarboxylase family protein [Planctomycetota bacterium]|jgi:uroporphyrinogen decarboxylase|nr:uroporphyrinogen decarboxylase family protein [Planctomycetota bacterium]MDP7252736.1 uroporphyrinogen decarboxylase family protein [Planctomycetota bacterium]
MSYPSRERVAKTFAHQSADRIPYDASGTRGMSQLVDSMGLDADHRSFCLDGDFRYVSLDLPQGDRGIFKPFLPRLPDDASLSCWGVGRIPLKTAEGHHAGHQYYHPLAGIDEESGLDEFPFPNFVDPRCSAGLKAKIKKAKTEGYTVVGQMSQTILETAYLMRGIEQLMIDFHERPEFVAALFEKLAERRRFQARVYAEAGVDVLRIGDDIATQQSLMVSLELYRDRIKPFHASAVSAARQINPEIQVLYHSDGDLTELLPDLIEIGVTAINPVQPECMDLAEIKQEFGRDLTLWGCCPVQSIYAHGEGRDIRSHLQFLTDEIATDGGLVLHFINMLVTPRVTENLRVFFTSFYEMGRYGG